MKLADLRKLSVRENLSIRFVMANGMECVVTEQGVARVPALAGVPDFNIESELAAANEFLLEPAAPAGGKPPKSRTVRRQELAAMAGLSAPAADSTHEEE